MPSYTARRPASDELMPYELLQGHAVTTAPAPHHDIWLFEEDLPDHIEQSAHGPDPGHGAFAASGLAADAAKLHIKAVVVAHFSVATAGKVISISF